MEALAGPESHAPDGFSVACIAAAPMMPPYLVWVTFAGALDLAILRMNRGRVPAAPFEEKST